MVQIPSVESRRHDMALIERGSEDCRSQRSASVDVRCNVPFSLAESPLQANDVDSAHASINDWLDEFNRGGLDGPQGGNLLTTISPHGQITPEFEFSEQPAIAFKLPDMHDVSEIDQLNQAFVNEHSMVNPHVGGGVIDVQNKLYDL